VQGCGYDTFKGLLIGISANGRLKGLSKTITSISVNPDLWRAARKFAIDKRITISELLELSLRAFMKIPQEGQLRQASASVAEVRSKAARKAWNTRRSKGKKP